MSLFSSTEPKPKHDNEVELQLPEETKKVATLAVKQLEDWAYRLQSAADEAYDERLVVLESNLLDLRDEVVAELHAVLS